MRLSILHEAANLADLIITAMGRSNFKKQQDAGRPEKLGTFGNELQPAKSGVEDDPPLSPRHRRFFNAPGGGAEGIGYGDEDDFESKRARPAKVGDDQLDTDYPIDKSKEQKDAEKRAIKTFGHLAQAGQPGMRA